MEGFLNKRAQTPGDAILAIVFILAILIGGLFAFYIFGKVFDGFESSSINTSITYPVFEKGRAVNSMWDYIILALTIGFALAVIITGYFIDVHSIFVVLYIIGLVIGEIIAFILSYVWSQIVTSSPAEIAVVVNTNFTISNAIMQNLPMVFAAIGVLGMIATYGKVNQQ